MGQKVHPTIFRIPNIFDWPSRWFKRKSAYRHWLKQDLLIRQFLEEKLKACGVEKIEIERNTSSITITIFTARPGVVIGRGGASLEEIKKYLQKNLQIKENININVKEVENPNLSAPVILESMIDDLEKRVPYRRVLKKALEKISKAGALGAKVWVAGRLNGAEIARTETLSFGKLPLHNLRANIDYAFGEAQTIYGKLGVKVWIYKGEIFDKEKK